jgi:hypothetical protein
VDRFSDWFDQILEGTHIKGIVHVIGVGDDKDDDGNAGLLLLPLPQLLCGCHAGRLILPLLSLCASLVITLGIFAFQNNTSVAYQRIDDPGAVISDEIEDYVEEIISTPQISAPEVLYVFFLYNIPTMAFLAIYIIQRKQKSRQ